MVSDLHLIGKTDVMECKFTAKRNGRVGADFSCRKHFRGHFCCKHHFSLEIEIKTWTSAIEQIVTVIPEDQGYTTLISPTASNN